MTLAASTLDLVQQAHRRARLAGLLGRLLLEEPGPGIADLVAGVPTLRALGERDPELAVEYERLFLRAVPVEESVFLGDDGQRGGPLTARVMALYRSHDFDELARWRVGGADHLGLQLRCYAVLCSQEAIAWEDDRPDRATRMVEAERSMLGAHFGQWAEIAMHAVSRRAQDSPYGAVAEAVSAFVAEEAERLRADPDHPGMPAVEVQRAPHRPGPARLARWLLAPARCGGYLDTPDIAAVAGELGIPWRPSDPRSRLREVIEASEDGGDLPELLWRLRPLVEDWACHHAHRETDRDGNRRSWRAWRLRADETVALIDRLRVPPSQTGPGDRIQRPVSVVVSGDDPAQRVRLAERVLERLGRLGWRASVSLDLPPELADDLGSLVAAGAHRVTLSGHDLTVIAVGEAGRGCVDETLPSSEGDVIVRLVAADGAARVTVSRPSTRRGDEVHQALDGLVEPEQPHDRRLSG